MFPVPPVTRMGVLMNVVLSSVAPACHVSAGASVDIQTGDEEEM
jgi:hypothetical protein